MIPYGQQTISDSDIHEIIDVLRSDFLTQGPHVTFFEQNLASYCESKHAVVLNSATSALHSSCLALGLNSGDWLWTSPISFVASANCGVYCGANIDFVDIDPESYNISIDCLKAKLISAKRIGRLPKVLVAVHMCGQSCDMEEIFALSNEYGFKVIEDASHAIGGSYKNQKIGSCKYSDITVFSFHPVKIITTGEGGGITTNNIHLADKIRSIRSHGITRDTNLMTHDADGSWYYQQIDLGYNYRMTDIQAALGSSQLKKVNEFVRIRNDKARKYTNALEIKNLTLPLVKAHNISSFHLYVIRIKQEGYSRDRKTIFDNLRNAGIGVNVHYIPIHLQPFYKNLGFKAGDFPNSEKYYSEAITLPIFPNLSERDQNYIIEKIHEVME